MGPDAPPGDVVPPSVLVSGPASTGKTTVLRHLLAAAAVAPHVCWIRCHETVTPRLLFEAVLNRICGVRPGRDNGFRAVRCDAADLFVDAVRDACGERDAADAAIGVDPCAWFLVLDDVDALLEIGAPTLLPMLMKLAELTRLNLCVVMVTRLSWDSLAPSASAMRPLIVTFPVYSKDKRTHEALAILSRACPPDEPRAMFDMFARVIYDTFSKACRDVGELLYLVERLFPKFIEPAVQGRVLRTQESKLFALFETHMRTALTSLFLRDTASAEWERKLGIGAGALRDPAAAPAAPPAADATEIAGDTERDGQDSRDRNNEVGGADRGNNDEAGDDGDDGDWRLTTAAPVRSAATGDVFELPYYAKFLLIASFLASYNPPRLDRRFFTKQGEGRRARKKAGGDLVQENKKLRQQLLGPKAFPVERMLAIFYSIVDSDLDAGFRVYSAIASLISLRLMLRVSGMDRLDDMRCKCNANYALVHRVAQSVRFDLSKYLFDFVALA